MSDEGEVWRPSFAAAVCGMDPEWERLELELAAEGCPEEIEGRYVPRTVRLFESHNRGSAVDELDLPPEGLDKEELVGFLRENGWPSERLQAKVYRGWRYIVSRTFAAEPEEEDEDEEGEEEGSAPAGGQAGGSIMGIIASPQGPAYIQQMLAVIGPGVAEVYAIAVRRAEEERQNVRLEAEIRLRRKLAEEDVKAEQLAFQNLPVGGFQR